MPGQKTYLLLLLSVQIKRNMTSHRQFSRFILDVILETNIESNEVDRLASVAIQTPLAQVGWFKESRRSIGTLIIAAAYVRTITRWLNMIPAAPAKTLRVILLLCTKSGLGPEEKEATSPCGISRRKCRVASSRCGRRDSCLFCFLFRSPCCFSLLLLVIRKINTFWVSYWFLFVFILKNSYDAHNKKQIWYQYDVH